MTERTRDLSAILPDLGDDEIRVLTLLAERLAHGRRQYGKLRMDGDQRDWAKEMREEALDLCVYSAIAEISTQRWRTADALAATQARCSELLEEVRALRQEATLVPRADHDHPANATDGADGR